MNQENKVEGVDEMEAEYDIRGGVRGKYAEQYRQGTNLVLLDADVAAAFPDTAAVNRALRLLIEVARQQVRTEAA